MDEAPFLVHCDIAGCKTGKILNLLSNMTNRSCSIKMEEDFGTLPGWHLFYFSLLPLVGRDNHHGEECLTIIMAAETTPQACNVQ